MKKFVSLMAVFGLSACCLPSPSVGATSDATQSANTDRPRVVVITDFPPLNVIPGSICSAGDPAAKCSDPDDVQSMVRFLLYSNELEVEALVAASGSFANVANKQHLLDMLNLYDKVDENLRRRDPRYPTADALRALTFQGMDGSVGTTEFGGRPSTPIESLIGPAHDTEASEAILRILLDPNPQPVWVCVWGGPRELAQAVWKIKNTRSAADLDRAIDKLRVYLILKQDYTAEWLMESFPKLFVILSNNNYQGMFWTTGGYRPELGNIDWVDTHIREGHGPLGAAYPRSGWDATAPGTWEGDTPSFLYLVSGLRGLGNPEHPDQGGWGGKFVRPDPSKNHWYDSPEGPEAIYRWRAQYQQEFAERANWMLAEKAPKNAAEKIK